MKEDDSVQSEDFLKVFINRLVEIPEDEWKLFLQLVKVKQVPKSEFFFRQGEQVRDIGFLNQGLLCNFYSDPEGQNHVKKFSTPRNPVACYLSLILGKAANYSCQALEDSRLILIPYDEMKLLYSRHSCWEKLGRLIAEKLYIEKEFREQSFLVNSAQERYEIFCQEFPQLLNQVPQYLIASYIGISPVALSRLRSQRRSNESL